MPVWVNLGDNIMPQSDKEILGANDEYASPPLALLASPLTGFAPPLTENEASGSLGSYPYETNQLPALAVQPGPPLYMTINFGANYRVQHLDARCYMGDNHPLSAIIDIAWIKSQYNNATSAAGYATLVFAKINFNGIGVFAGNKIWELGNNGDNSNDFTGLPTNMYISVWGLLEPIGENATNT